MEVIHSGNCDCPFPGRGCDFPGWPRPGRTVRPLGPAVSRQTRSPARRKMQVRRSRCVGTPPAAAAAAAAAGRPGGPAAPRPPRSLLQPDFLFAASRPRLTSRAGKLPKAASFSETPPPASLHLLPPLIPPPAWEPTRGRGRGKRVSPAGQRAGLPGPRCPAPEGAARPAGLRTAGGRSQPFSVLGPDETSRGTGRRPRVQFLSLWPRALYRPPPRGSKLKRAQRKPPGNTPQGIQRSKILSHTNSAPPPPPPSPQSSVLSPGKGARSELGD